MQSVPKYYIVESKALPDVFVKVAMAKWLLENGNVQTVNEAVKKMGISRSAFYKYRDSILSVHDVLRGRVLSFRMLLRDAVGVLASILCIFAKYGANILSLHQALPESGYASIHVSVDTTHMSTSAEGLLRAFAETEGVCKAEILAG